MWIFGYGSLMTDGWETELGCTQRMLAELAGYRRVFNKASVTNWGTREHPGPTLNLAKTAAGSCRGVAFEFPKNRNDEVFTELHRREGQNFSLYALPVQLLGGDKVTAHTAMYTGRNILKNKSLDEIVTMIMNAKGTKGMCVAYIKNVAAELPKASINDPAVTAVCDAVSARLGEKILA